MLEEFKRKNLFEKELTQENYSRCWRYACRLTQSKLDAEDLLQDTLTQAYLKIEQYQINTSFRAWVLTIMRNKFLTLKRKLKIEVCNSSYVINNIPNEQPSLIQEQVIASLNLLSFEHQEIIQLYYYELLELNEIAQILQMSKGSAKLRLFRAREALKKHLTQQIPVLEAFSLKEKSYESK